MFNHDGKMPRVKHNYLGLRARLSQAWLCSPFLILVLFIVKLVLLKAMIKVALDGVEQLLLTECQVMNDVVAWLAQAPQHTLEMVNRVVENSVNSTIEGLMHSLELAVTAIENLIMFALQMTVGTYACLTISAVNIAANEAINASESVIKSVNSTAAEIGRDINAGLGKLSKLINGASGLIGTVEDFILGGDHEIEKVNLTVDKLNHLSINSSVITKLENLRKDVPTYDGTKAAVKAVIDKPFKLVRSEIRSANTSVNIRIGKSADVKALFSASMAPTCKPSKIKKDFKILRKGISKLVLALCLVCAIFIIGGIIYNMWRVQRRWALLEEAATTDVPFMDKDVPIDMREANLSRITYYESSYAERLLLRQIPTRYWWPVRYSLSRPIIVYCLIGLCGFLISLLELIVINTLHSGAKKFLSLEHDALEKVTDRIKENFFVWRNHTNNEILTVQSKVNRQLLGWIHEGSKGVNASLATFMGSINKEIDSTFNNTVFEAPLQAVVKCLIGDKVKAVEKGLNWTYRNSKVSLPLVPRDFHAMMNNSNPRFLDNLESKASAFFSTAVNAIRGMIFTQLLVSGIFLSVWLLFVIGAFMVTIFPDKFSKAPEQSQHSRSPPPPLEKISTLKMGIHHRTTCISPKVKSPAEKFGNRVTQIFRTPCRRAALNVITSPLRGSIVLPETPRTPVKAMYN